LCSLLNSDRVKTTLSESSMSHVLRVETTRENTWAKPDDLAEILDIYFANCDSNERPRASAIGVRPTTQSHRPFNKPSNQFVNINNGANKTENKLSKLFG